MRLRSLDAARGIAALVVVATHLVGTLPTGAEDRDALLARGYHAHLSWLYLTPLRLAVAGSSAVVFFFVLSGLVLAMTFVDRDGDRYPPFLTKRVARIWLPFAVAILFSVVADALLSGWPVAGLSTTFYWTWGEPLTPHLVASHLLMTGKRTTLDGPMWSLVHEMRVSVVFPLLVVASRLSWKLTLGATAAVGMAAVAFRPHLHIGGPVDSLLQTVAYVYLFVAGIVIALYSRPIRSRIGRSGPLSRAVLWIVAASCLMAWPRQTPDIATLSDTLLLMVVAVGAVLALMLCLADRATIAVLSRPIPLFLGRISYSLYLTHLIVITAVMRLLAALPAWVGLAVAAVAALLVATLFQRWLEVPSARLGRWAADRLAGRVQAAAATEPRAGPLPGPPAAGDVAVATP